MGGSFGETLDMLRHYSGDEATLADLIAPLFPVATVSVMALGILPATVVSATDPLAVRVDELQLDLGEGPVWDALKEALPVLEPDLLSRPRRVWPAFSAALAQEDVGALFVFPLRVGHLGIGVITLISRIPMELSVEHGRQAGLLAGVMSALLLRRAFDQTRDDSDQVPEVHSRRSIHQATGMVIAQANVGAADAELLIRGHAFAHNKTMRQVADEILQRRLAFQPLTMGSEDR
jgi:hypothetical protein